MRVVADHIRAATFLIADGVIPSNEWRGYVLRKIMRRAMRHGKHLGFDQPFLHALVGVVDREMGDAYPEVRGGRATIEKAILAEEHRFDTVLKDGLPRLEAELNKVLGTRSRVLSGDAAFRLYDTFGIPYLFIEDTAASQGVTVDQAGFEAAMEAQRAKARAKGAFDGQKSGEEFVTADEAGLSAAGDRFEGYASTRVSGVPILALFDDRRRPTDALTAGQHGYLALAATPFYLEAGGQVSDSGRVFTEAGTGSATVEGVAAIRQGLPRAHRVRVDSGALHVRDLVTAEVDAENRDATRRNHTATHLLHAALRQVLGAHVKQAGSLVAPDRLRFDFVHPQPLGAGEIEQIERIVNQQIYRNTAVITEIRSTDEAVKAGAMALFGEKYGDRVRVVSVPGFSMELCGGTHVSATGDIGFFVIVAQSGVGAGVRRIEALTGAGAVAWAQQRRAALDAMLEAIHAPEDQAVAAIERLQAESKRLGREVTQLRTKLAAGGGAGDGSQAAADTIDVAGVKLMRRKVADVDKEALRGLADSLRAKIRSGIVVLASAIDGKAQVVVAVTPDLTARAKAGQIVKELAPIIGGAGGGRPDFAEAGGRQPEHLDRLLEASEAVVSKLLNT
jgi:alanyl-tRNA synthetase